MTDQLTSQIVKWTETSGRALELRTARTLRSADPRYVRQSVAYTDTKTSDQREGDVLGVFHWVNQETSLTLDAAVECKGGTEHPWVAFFEPSMPDFPDPAHWFRFSDSAWPDRLQGRILQAIREAPSTLPSHRIATHAVAALGKDSNNVTMGAVRQAVSFAKARVKSTVRFFDDPPRATPVKAVMPIVVTRAPLFTCELDDDGKVDVRRVQGFDIMLPQRYGVGRAYVRSESAFEELARDMAEAVRTVGMLMDSD